MAGRPARRCSPPLITPPGCSACTSASGRSRLERAPTSSYSTPRSSTSPIASATTRCWPPSGVASSGTCARTPQPGSMSEPPDRYEIAAMPNAHSHAFQRGLRGVGERPSPAASGGDDFWSWREAMYRLAESLDPASIHEAAAATFDEMVRAGYGAVGEFHYVHHQPDG